MISVTLFRKGPEKYLTAVETRGHAGSGRKGEDVVCAAVSALIHALYLGLRDAAGVPVERKADAAAPFIGLNWPEERAAEVRLLTDTVALSLKEIASRYAGHVSISEVYL